MERFIPVHICLLKQEMLENNRLTGSGKKVRFLMNCVLNSIKGAAVFVPGRNSAAAAVPAHCIAMAII
jgi:hypothetical protein